MYILFQCRILDQFNADCFVDFFRILKTSINTFLMSDDDNLNRNMSECAKMVCHGQHTYVYAQVSVENVLTWIENRIIHYYEFSIEYVVGTCSGNVISLFQLKSNT